MRVKPCNPVAPMKSLPWCALLLLTACADVCQRGEALSTSFPERQTACFAPNTLPSSPVFDAKACDTSMNACTQIDERALHQYFDCVEALPVCTAATRAVFNEKFLQCASGMGRLTEGCFRP